MNKLPYDIFIEVIQLLSDLISEKYVPKDHIEGLGVCGVVEAKVGVRLHILISHITGKLECIYHSDFYNQFKYYSGDNLFPVKHPYIENAEDAYHSTTIKWGDGAKELDLEYYLRRKLFCVFLKEKFETFLDNQNT